MKDSLWIGFSGLEKLPGEKFSDGKWKHFYGNQVVRQLKPRVAKELEIESMSKDIYIQVDIGRNKHLNILFGTIKNMFSSFYAIKYFKQFFSSEFC